jgi:hypothetical protein
VCWGGVDTAAEVRFLLTCMSAPEYRPAGEYLVAALHSFVVPVDKRHASPQMNTVGGAGAPGAQWDNALDFVADNWEHGNRQQVQRIFPLCSWGTSSPRNPMPRGRMPFVYRHQLVDSECCCARLAFDGPLEHLES